MKDRIKKMKRFIYGTLILFTWLPYNNYGQSIKRQCISSLGSSVLSDNLFVGQTVGQNFATNSYIEDKTAVLQGYQQPVIFTIEKINSDVKDLKINIYPNPATYLVTIQSEEIINKSVIQVTDLTGRLVLYKNIDDLTTYNINCNAWGNGTYIITIFDKNQNKSSHKLIINK